MINNRKAVALVEWNWQGHHPTYFLMYVRALLELGCEVLALCPEPESLIARLREQGVPEEFLTRLTAESCVWAAAPSLPHPRRLSHGLATAGTFLGIHRQLKAWEQRTGRRIGLTFFCCIYDHQFKHFHLVWNRTGRPWAGLYLHCRAFRLPGTVVPNIGQLPCPERFLKARHHVALALLDEGVGDQVTVLSGRPTVFFPDITDPTLPTGPTVLERKLKDFAGARPVVGSLGHLQYTKGSTLLAGLALRPEFSGHVMAFIGETFWESFGSADRFLLRTINETAPNAFTHFERPTGEKAFNALFTACDVIFAAYLDFPNSSNILTKCAVFEKPVIVSEGSLMAERVRAYRMGEVIPEGDLDAAGAAVRRITADVPGWIARHQPRWAEYREVHSYETLRRGFAELLPLVD